MLFVSLDKLKEGDFVYDCEEHLHLCRGRWLPGATAYGRVAPRGILASDLSAEDRDALESGGTAALLERFWVLNEQFTRK